MRHSGRLRFALCSFASSLFLSACAASQPQIPPPTAHPAGWILREAAREPLLYVTDQDQAVYILSYPEGKMVGTLSGVNGAQGVCSDGSGHVFVTAFNSESVFEFAHAGTTPIRKLDDFGYYPIGCAIDPLTGNLAVANYGNMSGGGGSVAIYAGAQGKPVYYPATGFLGLDWCSYDSQGNLLVDAAYHGFAELPAGSQSFVSITAPVSGEGIHWDGKYFAVVNPLAKQIYRLTIANGTGIVTSTLDFSGGYHEVGNDFAIVGGTLVMPYAKRDVDSRIGFWSYSKGGSPHKTRRYPGDTFFSIALSR
jgi:DNA-binding beta-propeller fold protein YncE